LKAVWLSIVENSASSFFGAGVNIAILFVTARALGPAGRGLFVAVTTWVALAATLAGLSLGQVSHRQFQQRTGDAWLAELFGTMIMLASVACVVAFVMIWFLAMGAEGSSDRMPRRLMALAGVMLPLLVLDDYARNLLASTARLRTYAAAQAVGSALKLLLVLAAIGPLGLGVSGAVLALVLGQSVVVAVEVRALWQEGGRSIRVSLRQALALLKDSLRLHPNTVASFLLIQGNVLLLSHFAGSSAVGLYQLAQQLVLTMLLIPQAASLTLYSKVAQLGPDRAWPHQKRLMAQVIAVIVTVGVLAVLVVPVFIRLFAGPAFAPAADIFRVLVLSAVGMSLAEMMAPQWFGRGVFLPATMMTCVCAVISLVLGAVLIRRSGVAGAAWTSFFVYFVLVTGGQCVFGLFCEARYRRMQSSTAQASTA